MLPNTQHFRAWMLLQGYSVRTAIAYGRLVARCEEWLRRDGRPAMRRAKAWDLRSFAEALPYTYSSRQAFRSAMSAYWAYLGRKDPPVKAIRCPKQPKGRNRAIEPEQWERVRDEARRRGAYVYAAICCMYYAALRREEVVTLRWDGIRDGWLRGVGKGAKPYELLADARLLEALDALPRENEWVLPGRWPGTHLSPATLNLWTNIVGAAAGLPLLTPHMLRYTSLTTANDVTGDLRAVQEFARHEDPRTTARYTRATERRLRKVLAAL